MKPSAWRCIELRQACAFFALIVLGVTTVTGSGGGKVVAARGVRGAGSSVAAEGTTVGATGFGGGRAIVLADGSTTEAVV